MDALVGYTGFVGSNLLESHKFDKLYNSKNIREAYGLNPDLLVYAGIRAEMFLANQDPEADLRIINDAFDNIKIINPKKIVLISTVAVYGDDATGDEDKVIDKNKLHNTVTLLTPTGVVNVKIYKNQFAIYDKQLSERDNEGKKHIIEKSWLTRGNKLMIQGFRRGQDFIPKKTKQSVFPIISKIINIKDDGSLEFQYERMEVDA